MQPTENMDTLFVTVKDTRKGKKEKEKNKEGKGGEIDERWSRVQLKYSAWPTIMILMYSLKRKKKKGL